MDRAVCRVLVKYLHPGLFTYRGTCDKEGSLILGAEFEGEKGGGVKEDLESRGGFNDEGKGRKDFQKVLKKELEELIPKYRNKGFPMILIALGLNIPWIVVLKGVGGNNIAL